MWPPQRLLNTTKVVIKRYWEPQKYHTGKEQIEKVQRSYTLIALVVVRTGSHYLYNYIISIYAAQTIFAARAVPAIILYL